MWNECTPILVGMASLVLEIWFLLVSFQIWPSFPFKPWAIQGDQKIESAHKIHASRGWCEMHVNQFWWAWLIWFWRFCSFSLPSKQPNFPFRPWTIIVHGSQKIELTQKTHASRVDMYEMHASQFWWAWPLQFWRYCYISNLVKMGVRK